MIWVEALHEMGVPVAIGAFAWLVFVYCAIILPSVWFTRFFERKLAADFQARVGPDHAGLHGFLQPLADLLKQLQKHGHLPPNRKENAWLLLYSVALCSTLAVLPLGARLVLVDTPTAGLIPFWAVLALSLGAVVLGTGGAARSVPAGLGSIRVASQAIIAALPAILSFMCAAVASRGFSWTAFVGAQGAWPASWTVFSGPFQWIAFLVFLASGLALLGVAPFDSGFSSDLQRGVESNLSGRRLALFQLGRFYAFFFWSLVAVAVFLGGWNLPSALQFGEWAGALTVIIKAYLLMIGVTWFARANPRIRVDQTAAFLWKVATPLAAIALLGQTAWVYLKAAYL